jgi:hypothetical protein
MNAKENIAAIKSRLSGKNIGMEAAIAENQAIAAKTAIEARKSETEAKARIREEHPATAEFMRLMMASGMMDKTKGAAYHITAPGIDLKMGSFEPKITVGWNPLSAAEYRRLGKDCEQCGFYKHGSCINGAKAVKKSANDTCSKHSWKGFFA